MEGKIRTVNYIILIILALPGVYIIADNWRKVFLNICKKKTDVYIPVIGALSVFLSVYFWPGQKPAWVYILPWIIDYGTVPLISVSLIYAFIHRKDS